MPADPLAFLDGPVKESAPGNDPLSFLPEYSKSPLRKPARHLAQAAKGALNLNPVVASYNLATTLGREGAYRSRKRVTEQAKKDIKALDEKRAKGEKLSRTEERLYDRTKQLAERKNEKAAGIDTESLINRGVKTATGVDLEPEDLGENITNIAASLINPRTALSKAKNLPKLFSAEGRTALKAERAIAKTEAGWDALNRVAKGNPEKEGIINWAQQKGLNPRETTLLLQSERKINTLGKASKKTKQFEKDVTGLKEKLGASYEEFKNIGREGGHLGFQQVEALSDDLRKITADLEHTLIKGPDTKAAITAIEEGMTKLQNYGTSIGELVSTRQNLGQSINWKNVDPKGVMLNRARESFMKAIENANPKVAKELRATDKAWRQYEKFKDVLDKKQAFTMVNGVPVPSGSVVFWGALGSKALLGGLSPATAAKYYGIKEGISRLSTAMLTNPKLQGIRGQLMKAVLSGNEEKQRKLMISAQKIIKTDDPDLYDELGLEG